MIKDAEQQQLVENLVQELRRGVVVLAVLNELVEEQYGYQILKQLAEKGLSVDQGTLYPLLAEAMTGEKLSVGPPYFNATAGPLALILVALLLFAPLLRWRHDRRPKPARILPGTIAALIALGLTFVSPSMMLLARLGLALAGGLAIASLLPLVGRNLLRTPLATWGMAIAHFGVAVALAGMAIDSSFTVEKLAAAREGETLVVGPWAVTFARIDPVAGPNWTALEARLDASRGDERVMLTPQARTFSDPPTETSETAIATRWDGQLYTVLGKQGDDGRWQLRLWWKPFVTLIWLGGALIGELRVEELFAGPGGVAEFAQADHARAALERVERPTHGAERLGGERILVPSRVVPANLVHLLVRFFGKQAQQLRIADRSAVERCRRQDWRGQ